VVLVTDDVDDVAAIMRLPTLVGPLNGGTSNDLAVDVVDVDLAPRTALNRRASCPSSKSSAAEETELSPVRGIGDADVKDENPPGDAVDAKLTPREPSEESFTLGENFTLRPESPILCEEEFFRIPRNCLLVLSTSLGMKAAASKDGGTYLDVVDAALPLKYGRESSSAAAFEYEDVFGVGANDTVDFRNDIPGLVGLTPIDDMLIGPVVLFWPSSSDG